MHEWLPHDFLARLLVEPVTAHEFESRLEGWEGRTFGGETLAKAVSAALATCPGRGLHSLHAYFLRPVPADKPVRFVVHGLRDGRRLAGRRVAVQCDGRKAAEVTMSLAEGFDGPGFQDEPLNLDAPKPADVPTLEEFSAAEDLPPPSPRPIEWRYIEYPWRKGPAGESSRWRAWIKPSRPLPDDASTHVAALVYLSDHGSLGCLPRRLGERFDWSASASVDHAFWLHAPFRWDDWILMDTRNEIASGSRALTERRIYTADGRRVASVMQEALFHVIAD